MTAVWTRVRSELSRRVGGTILIILFLGVAGGAVIGALAGARRTDTAYPRMRAATGAGDVLISVEEQGAEPFYEEVGRLPAVEAIGVAVGLDLLLEAGPPAVDDAIGDFLPALAAADGRLLTEVARPRVTAGRLPRQDRPDEAFANRFLAAEGVDVGSTLEVRIGATTEEDPKATAGPVRRVTVVGTGILPNEVLPIAVNDSFPTLFVTAAFYRQYAGPAYAAFDGAFARLRPGTDAALFRTSVSFVFDRYPHLGGLFYSSEEERTAIVQRAVRPQVVALQLFAILSALTILLTVGQALARQLYGDASDYPTMRALGMTQRQLFVVGMLRAGAVATGAAVIAVVFAIGASPLMPLGTARLAEPDPGISVDTPLLALGALAMIVLVLLTQAVPALFRARARATVGAADPLVVQRSSRVAAALARSGAPAAMTTGVRMAVDPGRGRTSAPVRSAIAGTILAIAALAATVTFSSSLDRLVETPHLYGQNWDVTVDAGFGTIPIEPAAKRLRDLPEVAAFSGGLLGELDIQGSSEVLPITTIGIDPIEGNVAPTMLEGRAPRTTDEIALGTTTLRDVRRRVGQTLGVVTEAGPRTMKIVGRAVFPQFGLGSFTPTGLGDGALTTAAGLHPEADGSYNVVLVRLRPGAPADAADRVFHATVDGISECDAGFCGSSRDIRPGDVTNYARIRSTPVVLSGLLTILAVAAIAHALITSVRRRARELAVLKTMGFVRRQIYGAVAWQASTLAAVSLAIGVPAGILAGRAVWTSFAGRLGVAREIVVPITVILLGVVAALVVANIAATFPGARAARLQPAVVLRDE
ncbi:MAG: FtsX-like permease family protein [Actinomycetota bacterium]